MAIRRRNTVLFARSDKLFTRLRAGRLDDTVDAAIRRLATIDVLIIEGPSYRQRTRPGQLDPDQADEHPQ